MTLDVGKCPNCHPIVSKINKLWQKCQFSHKSSVSQNRHGRQKVAIFLTFRFRRHAYQKCLVEFTDMTFSQPTKI